jgi:rod shape-determining protein MreD
MRLALFYLLLLLAQGLFSALLSPWPPPDLFFVAVLTLLRRLPAWQLVLAAYGIGLFQDVLGHGVLGLHAFGLAAASVAALLVRAQLTQSGLFERMALVAVGLCGKWFAVTASMVWITGTFDVLNSALRVVPFDIGFTLGLSVWLLPLADALFRRASVMRKELM